MTVDETKACGVRTTCSVLFYKRLTPDILSLLMLATNEICGICEQNRIWQMLTEIEATVLASVSQCSPLPTKFPSLPVDSTNA
jgi:hypothetical protein